MSPRYMCPSMGAIRRPLSRSLSQDVAVLSNYCARSFHVVARQLADQPGDGSSSGSSVAEPTRRHRNAAAASRINSLQHRRPLPRTANLVGGSFRGGSSSAPKLDTTDSSPSPTDSSPSPTASSTAPSGLKILTPRKPLLTRKILGPGQVAANNAGAPAGPPGTMIRAPSTLRITRNAPTGQRTGGPNLRGRGATSSSQGEKERAPKKRGFGSGSAQGGQNVARKVVDAKPEEYLSDGMVQHLLRLQRKEWDRVPYEPKYAQGSFAANELVHTGRELFRGDSPDVPVWGRLEKTLGVVGMHGAAGRLQVRRVVDRADGSGKQAGKNYYKTDVGTLEHV